MNNWMKLKKKGRDYFKAIRKREAFIIANRNKIDKINKLKLDFFATDYYLTRKESRPYLCQICKLVETCSINFDYECVEASDFLFKPKAYTVKYKSLNGMDKNYILGDDRK